MKDTIVTNGIILARTNFQEADRIVTILTPNHGKLHVIAKGVRKQKSKLAGGIELFCVSELTVLPGRGEIHTLVSTRMATHYRHITTDIHRTMLGYEFLKRINRLTEDASGEEYYDLLQSTLAGLDETNLDLSLLELWFSMQLLKISGTSPNLTTNASGGELIATENYIFDYDAMAFASHSSGPYDANCIKLLRLAVRTTYPIKLVKLSASHTYIADALNIANLLLRN